MINTQAVQALIDTLAEKFADDAVIVDAIKAADLTPSAAVIRLSAQLAASNIVGFDSRIRTMNDMLSAIPNLDDATHKRLLEEDHTEQSELRAERDAARAEVARVTELAITERDSAAREIERLTAALKDAEKMARVIEGLDEYSFDSDGQFFAVDFGDETIHPDSLIARFRAALRGDTSQAVCQECHGTRRMDTEEFGRIICPMCKE